MWVEENKVIARRFGEDVWGKGDLDAVDELFAHGFVDHRAFPGQAPGPEGQKQNVVMTRSAFPDLRITNEDIIAEGDKVVLRWTGHGTHRGELMGIAPTGNHVEMGAMDLFLVAGGKIAETWSNVDMMTMIRQLGAIPTPERSGEAGPTYSGLQ